MQIAFWCGVFVGAMMMFLALFIVSFFFRERPHRRHADTLVLTPKIVNNEQ